MNRMMINLNAKLLADDLRDFLEISQGQLALVDSVYPHAVNLSCGDQLITLTNQEDITPMGLLLEGVDNFVPILNEVDQIRLMPEALTTVSGSLLLNISKAEIWKSKIAIDKTLKSRQDIVGDIERLINWLSQKPALGLLPLLGRLTKASESLSSGKGNLYSRHIADELGDFNLALQREDWQTALQISDKLIGFGMGSTPSCDDFLAAWLLILQIFNQLYPEEKSWIQEFGQAILEKAQAQTTDISIAMLKNAIQGKTNLSHQRLVTTVLFNHEDDLLSSAEKVLQHGASSGGDFMLGLLCALNWFTQNMKTIDKEGEQAP